ncbi:MAG: TonB-dependent receptor [Mucilaginibacter sp.]|uniref:TonB-dependent receptor n=1 Tax=Mucilaginibacter sp. TaxID=1882438 RepID=UPI0031A867E2
MKFNIYPSNFKNRLPYNLARIIKLTFFLLLILTFNVNAIAKAQQISLNENGASIARVLKEIKAQSNYNILFNDQMLADAYPVTVRVKDVSLTQALDECFKDQPLTYEISNNTIVLKRKAIVRTTITGKVTDATGKPLPGVTITAEREKKSVVTDQNGAFTINTEVGDKLIVKMIGYADYTTIIGDQKDYQITLKVNNELLTEVVVVGYGTQKKVNITGAVSSVNGTDLSKRPVTSVGSALQGQMPGVTVRNQTALPGQSGGEIRIRGIGTLNDASPLLVIDGVPSGDINILNPEDIENISVLKDAASSSIYGVRGANGVILVTTKKGKNNTGPSITYNNYFGFQTPTALPKYLGSVDYMELLNEAKVNAGANPTYTQQQIDIARNGSDPNYYANTDWIKELYKKNAPQQNHNLSLSGGGNNVNYYISYGYLKEGGLITGDNYNSGRHNVRARVSTTLFDRLVLDANIGYIDRAYSGSNEDLGSGSGPISVAQLISPLVPVRFTTGGWGYLGGSRNPIAVVTDGGYNKFSSQEFTANLQGTLNITSDFRLRGQYGLIRSNSLRNQFAKTINYYSPIDNSLIYQTNNPNKVTNTDYTNLYQTAMAMAEYEHTFGENHYLKAFAAVSSEQTVTNSFTASRTNLPTQDLGSLNLGTLNQLNSSSGTQNALESLFGRVNYAYKQRYLLEGDFRYDGSSRFAPNLRWNWFMAGSAGWVFSEENFFKSLKHIIESGKLRVSYGTQGNDKIALPGQPPIDFAYLANIGSVTTEPIGNVLTVGYRQTGIPNTLLTWESVTKQNIGLDLVMLKGRLGVTADYYIDNTNNILLSVPLPDVLGTGYPPQNAGKVQNKGWELAVTYKDKIQDFNYSVSFNISDVKNKVVSLGNVPPTFGDQVKIVGYPIDSFYGFVADRISQVSDYNYDANTKKYTPKFAYDASYPMQPGDLMYKDLNGDGKITPDKDMKVIGSPIPRYTYGFTTNMAYKGFDLTVFLQGVGKANGYINGAARYAFINDSSNPQQIHLDRWTPTNTDASYPRLVYGYSYNERLSTKWLEDASYFRVKNIQLGYTLPKSITEKWHVGRLRVYASADNLFTSTNFYYGYDPESPVSAGGYYPQVKTYVFGLNLNLK